MKPFFKRGAAALAVSAPGVLAVLPVVSMVQKQRGSGILRAMGAGQRRILTVLLLQGWGGGHFGAQCVADGPGAGDSGLRGPQQVQVSGV